MGKPREGIPRVELFRRRTGKRFPHGNLLSGRIIVFAIHVSSPHLVVKSKCILYELQQIGCSRDHKLLPLMPFRMVSEK